MKLDKGYYQNVIDQLSKILLKEKNKISQKLDRELKDYGYSIGYETKELNIVIQFKKKNVR